MPWAARWPPTHTGNGCYSLRLCVPFLNRVLKGLFLVFHDFRPWGPPKSAEISKNQVDLGVLPFSEPMRCLLFLQILFMIFDDLGYAKSVFFMRRGAKICNQAENEFEQFWN